MIDRIERLALRISARLAGINPEQRLRLRKILTIGWIIALVVIAMYLLRNQREDLRDIWTNLKNADRKWLAVAAVAEIAGITSVAWTFKLTLKRLGHWVSIPYLVMIHVERAGVNFAAPFGGAVTGYVFLDRMGRKGVPPEDSVLTLAIRTMSVWGATLIVLVITAFLTDSPIMIAVGVIALVAGVISLFYLSRQGQGDWKSLIRYSKRLPEKYSGRVEEGVARLKTHHLTPGDLIGSVGTTLLTRTATITLIYACVRSLGEIPSLSTVFLAYVVSYVAGRLVPFLYGMGLIEASLAIALQRGGVSPDVAVGASLLFRFYDFFVPSIVGLLIYSWDEHRHSSGSGKPGVAAGSEPASS